MNKIGKPDKSKYRIFKHVPKHADETKKEAII